MKPVAVRMDFGTVTGFRHTPTCRRENNRWIGAQAQCAVYGTINRTRARRYMAAGSVI